VALFDWIFPQEGLISPAACEQSGRWQMEWFQNSMPNPAPAFLGFQLLRSIGQTAQKQAQFAQNVLQLSGVGMIAG